MRFTLSIDLGNEAMQTPANVVSALDSVSQSLLDGCGPTEWHLEAGYIRDVNGNPVGEWELHEDDDE